MMESPDRVDAAVIGGGPAGATVATLLARHGLSVTVFERQTFPRFHIGESLLPGSMPIFQELGVYEEMDKQFIKKPGGKWYYGARPVFSDFACGPADTSFAETPHAYMVKRDELDQMLLANAARTGVQVLQQHSVIDLIQEGEKVVGVTVRNDKDGQLRECRCDMVFDCSGFGAVAAKKFELRRANRLRTMAVFGHYRTVPLDKDVKNGWIVAPMFYNGWAWMIPLEKDLVSVGAVVSLEEFRKVRESPREFLERNMRNLSVVNNGLGSAPMLEGPVHLYGNLGYTTARACGDGWVLVGDAAFFIDPCYSSGVHLALLTAKKAAEVYLESRRTGQQPSMAFAEKYEKFLRKNESLVLRLVDAFYMTSRNRVLRWLIPAFNNPVIARRFVAVAGGDFARYSHSINMLYYVCKTVSFLVPVRTADNPA